MKLEMTSIVQAEILKELYCWFGRLQMSTVTEPDLHLYAAAACTKSLGRNASERWESDTVFDFDFLKSGVPVLSDQTNQPPPVDPRNVIMIIVYNQIPTDVIRVRCQSLHNSERMRDYGYRTICPLDQITWLVIQVNYQPDEVRCLFFWGRLSVLHSVYIDSPHHTTPTESYWMATTNGLNEYVHGLGYVLIKPWRNNSLNEFDWWDLNVAKWHSLGLEERVNNSRWISAVHCSTPDIVGFDQKALMYWYFNIIVDIRLEEIKEINLIIDVTNSGYSLDWSNIFWFLGRLISFFQKKLWVFSLQTP